MHLPNELTMNALAVTIALTNALARLACVVPGPGSYALETSTDLHRWTVVACGRADTTWHVGVVVPRRDRMFVRAWWRPTDKATP